MSQLTLEDLYERVGQFSDKIGTLEASLVNRHEFEAVRKELEEIKIELKALEAASLIRTVDIAKLFTSLADLVERLKKVEEVATSVSGQVPALSGKLDLLLWIMGGTLLIGLGNFLKPLFGG